MLVQSVEELNKSRMKGEHGEREHTFDLTCVSSKITSSSQRIKATGSSSSSEGLSVTTGFFANEGIFEQQEVALDGGFFAHLRLLPHVKAVVEAFRLLRQSQAIVPELCGPESPGGRLFVLLHRRILHGFQFGFGSEKEFLEQIERVNYKWNKRTIWFETHSSRIRFPSTFNFKTLDSVSDRRAAFLKNVRDGHQIMFCRTVFGWTPSSLENRRIPPSVKDGKKSLQWIIAEINPKTKNKRTAGPHLGTPRPRWFLAGDRGEE